MDRREKSDVCWHAGKPEETDSFYDHMRCPRIACCFVYTSPHVATGNGFHRYFYCPACDHTLSHYMCDRCGVVFCRDCRLTNAAETAKERLGVNNVVEEPF